MPITPSNPFKGRQYPGEVILLAVCWYLRYPLAYLHLSEILAERGLFIDASGSVANFQLRGRWLPVSLGLSSSGESEQSCHERGLPRYVTL